MGDVRSERWLVRGERWSAVGCGAGWGRLGGLGVVRDKTNRTNIGVRQLQLLWVEATPHLSLLTNHFSPLTVRTSRDSSSLQDATRSFWLRSSACRRRA
jgi:hypothetical protein